MRTPLGRLLTPAGVRMARAIRKARKRALSPREAVAKEAEAIAKQRFGMDLNGMEFIVEIDGQYAVNVAAMYEKMLTQ